MPRSLNLFYPVVNCSFGERSRIDVGTSDQGDELFDCFFVLLTLNHSDIDQAGSFVFPSAHLPNVLNRHCQVRR